VRRRRNIGKKARRGRAPTKLLPTLKRGKSITKTKPQSKKRVKQTLPIAQLVPGERRLERESVDEAKRSLELGSGEPPKVLKIGDNHYVSDGNHRVMAAKELGRDSIECWVTEHKPKRNVADYDADDCGEAIRQGLLGFNNIPVGSKEEKLAEYDDDEELL
jgi:ParB-like nuclease domain